MECVRYRDFQDAALEELLSGVTAWCVRSLFSGHAKDEPQLELEPWAHLEPHVCDTHLRVTRGVCTAHRVIERVTGAAFHEFLEQLPRLVFQPHGSASLSLMKERIYGWTLSAPMARASRPDCPIGPYGPFGARAQLAGLVVWSAVSAHLVSLARTARLAQLARSSRTQLACAAWLGSGWRG